jgi:hypothetical protein
MLALRSSVVIDQDHYSETRFNTWFGWYASAKHPSKVFVGPITVHVNALKNVWFIRRQSNVQGLPRYLMMLDRGLGK